MPRLTSPALSGRAMNPLVLGAVVSVWLATVGNWPLWRALARLPEMQSPRGLLFGMAFAVMIAAALQLLLSLVAWRRILVPVASVLLLAAAAGAYFMGAYGIVIDATMIVNVLQTDPREVRDLLNWRLALTLLLMGVLPLTWLWRMRPAPARGLRQAGLNLASAIASLVLMVGVGALSFADLSATMRNHKSLRYLINPLNSVYAVGRVVADAQAQPAGPPASIGADVRLVPRPSGSKPPLMLLVVGETARAANFSLNGYGRPTNPELGALGVVSYSKVTSCGTSTAASLPCMFSHRGRQGFGSLDGREENLLDLAHKAGLAVLWVDNQSGCKGLCDRVPSAAARTPAPGADPLPAGLCRSDGECLDMALLHGLDQRLAALPQDRRARGVLLVLHQMGSHGPAYHLRSPSDRKPFVPECTSNALQECDRQALVNAYDNTIAYTDHVLAQAIAWLKTQEATYHPGLLYVSDHGESLGENNLYLHGLPFALAPEFQTHVPLIAWWPSSTAQARRLPLACAAAQRDTAWSHDNLFHSVALWLDLRSAEVRPELDLLKACRSPD